MESLPPLRTSSPASPRDLGSTEAAALDLIRPPPSRRGRHPHPLRRQVLFLPVAVWSSASAGLFSPAPDVVGFEDQVVCCRGMGSSPPDLEQCHQIESSLLDHEQRC